LRYWFLSVRYVPLYVLHVLYNSVVYYPTSLAVFTRRHHEHEAS